MEPNYDLLRKTLEYITAHPDEHSQKLWGEKNACHTEFCFAGHALHLGGATLSWSERPDWWLDEEDGVYRPDLDGAVLPGETENLDPHAAAERLLGLTRAQSTHLFYTCKTIRGVTTAVTKLLEKEPINEPTEVCG